MVEYTVRYETVDDKGETRRQRNARFKTETPATPLTPEVGRYLLNWFWQLSRKRRPGPEPLTWTDIDSWARMTHTPIEPHEVQALMRIDDVWMKAAATELDSSRPKPQAPKASKYAKR